MSFFEAIKSCFSKYVSFKGRASRSEFWYFLLFELLVSILLSLLAYLISSQIVYIFDLLFMVVFFFPSLTVAVRRIHDIGKSGKLLLFYYLCLIVFIVLTTMFLSDAFGDAFVYFYFLAALGLVIYALVILVYFCIDSQPCGNRYGPNPKIINVAEIIPYTTSEMNSNYFAVPLVHRETVGTKEHDLSDNINVSFCHKCGAKLIIGSEFCHKCGTSVIKE